MTPGETVCPTGFGRIHCGESCSNAMNKLNYGFDSSSETADSYGCYFDGYTNTGYFNAPKKDVMLVCMANDIKETCPPTKAPTTGEPTTASKSNYCHLKLVHFAVNYERYSFLALCSIVL